MLAAIIFIVSIVISIMIVNFAYKLFATILGGTLFYSVKIKLIAYAVVFAIIGDMLGGY